MSPNELTAAHLSAVGRGFLEVRDEALAQTVTSVRRAMEEMQGVFAAFPLPRLPAEVRVGRDWAHMRPFDEHA